MIDPQASTNPQKEDVDPAYRDRFVTIPNIICGLRLAGSFVLIWLAMAENVKGFTGLFVVLSLSDWIDGKLARWLNQRSDFGARLDSFADSILYAALLFGMLWMRWDVLRPEAPWWVLGILSYALTTGAGLWKYGRVPSYHTYGAKMTQWFVLVGATCILLDYSVWPFRLAMLAGIVTNLEAFAITWVLPDWHADVLSIFHARALTDLDQNRDATE